MHEWLCFLAFCLPGGETLVNLGALNSSTADAPVQTLPSSPFPLITSRCSGALGLLWGYYCLPGSSGTPSLLFSVLYQQASVVSCLLVAGRHTAMGSAPSTSNSTFADCILLVCCQFVCHSIKYILAYIFVAEFHMLRLVFGDQLLLYKSAKTNSQMLEIKEKNIIIIIIIWV